ncbi:MAG: SH3 domain-containing protein [Desulfomonilaceae bacterium]
MTKWIYVPVILIALTMVANIPNVTWAQNSQPAQAQTDQTGRQAPQPKGGVAAVVGVDEPENCLRIRSGPGNSYDVIGCANMGEQLNITGVWTSNDWAQLADNGWVYGPQIQTDLRPPNMAYSQPESYVPVDEYLNYYDEAFLPDYGYDTYWYGGIPIFLYDANVWFRHHPWWWHKGGHRDHRAWNRNPNFRTNVRTGTQRNFITNRSNVSPSNITRFNSTRFRSGSSNTIRSGRTFSNPNTIRSLRTFSNPNTIRMRNSGVTSFNTRNFNTRSFNTGSFGTRSFNTGSFGTRSFNAVRGSGFSGHFSGGAMAGRRR